MKLLIAGASSPSGKELRSLLRRQDVAHQAIPDRVIRSSDRTVLLEFLRRHKPTQIVNLHTYKANTQLAIIRAENAADKCRMVQYQHIRLLAEMCGDLDIPLIHLSNAYVFDGEKKLGYNEQDDVAPLGVYGKATVQAEGVVAKLPKHLILRSGWLFGQHHCDVIKRWIKACKKNSGVVEVGRMRISPTATEDLARVLLAICRQLDCDANAWGVYHYCGLETKKVSEFAQQVLKYASQHDEEVYQLLENIKVSEAQINAPEIANSTLSSKKIFDTFGIKQRSWHGSLQSVIKTRFHGPANSITPAAGEKV